MNWNGDLEIVNDIVDIYNVNYHFKLFCEDSLIVEGDGKYIDNFIKTTEIITEIISPIYGKINVRSGTFLKDMKVIDEWDDGEDLCYKISLPFKYLYTDKQAKEVHVEREIIDEEITFKKPIIRKLRR